jgi:hypothetical protein
MIPDAFRFALIAIAGTLGGLVLTASNNSHLSNNTRQEFINVSKKFIVSTILLIFFTVLFYNSNIFGVIDPMKLQEPIQFDGVYIAIAFWFSTLCFYLGITLFLLGIIEFINSLSHISVGDNPVIYRTIHHTCGYVTLPQYEIKGNQIFRTPTHSEGFLPSAQYEIRGKKLYRTSTHVDGIYPYPQYEIKGRYIYKTFTHVDGYNSLPQYEIRER